jgi:GeoRSP system PqqD family protein
MVDMPSRPRRNPEVAWREEPAGRASAMAGADEAPCLTMVHLGTMFQLNLEGAEIWKLADGQRTPAQITAAMAEAYDAPPERLAADVEAFLSDMTSRGWLLWD